MNDDQFLSDYAHRGDQPTKVLPIHVDGIVYKRRRINVLATERNAPFTIQIIDIQCTFIYNTCIMILVHVHAKQTNLRFLWNVIQTLWEHVQDLVRTSLGCCNKAFGVSFELVSDVERTCSVSRSNAFGFLFERVLASCSNAFGFSFERVWLFVQMNLAYRSNTSDFSFERVWLLVRVHFM